MEINLEFICGISLGFEYVDDNTVDLTPDERCIIVFDFFIIRAVVTIYK